MPTCNLYTSSPTHVYLIKQPHGKWQKWVEVTLLLFSRTCSSWGDQVENSQSVKTVSQCHGLSSDYKVYVLLTSEPASERRVLLRHRWPLPKRRNQLLLCKRCLSCVWKRESPYLKCQVFREVWWTHGAYLWSITEDDEEVDREEETKTKAQPHTSLKSWSVMIFWASAGAPLVPCNQITKQFIPQA